MSTPGERIKAAREAWASQASPAMKMHQLSCAGNDLFAAVDERDELRFVLERHGFRRCDAPACNCGSWHPVEGYKARFDEIHDALIEADVEMNGVTLLGAVRGVLSERDALRLRVAELERMRD